MQHITPLGDLFRCLHTSLLSMYTLCESIDFPVTVTHCTQTYGGKWKTGTGYCFNFQEAEEYTGSELAAPWGHLDSLCIH